MVNPNSSRAPVFALDKMPCITRSRGSSSGFFIVNKSRMTTARELLRKNRRAGAAIRLLGVQTSGLAPEAGQLDLLAGAQQERMGKVLSAMDKLRDKYGERSVSLALGMQGRFKERTHEALPNAIDKTGKPKK